MNEIRENLIDRMIKIYGYENPIVIQFCHLCETWEDTNWNNSILRLLVESHEDDPYKGEN